MLPQLLFLLLHRLTRTWSYISCDLNHPVKLTGRWRNKNVNVLVSYGFSMHAWKGRILLRCKEMSVGKVEEKGLPLGFQHEFNNTRVLTLHVRGSWFETWNRRILQFILLSLVVGWKADQAASHYIYIFHGQKYFLISSSYHHSLSAKMEFWTGYSMSLGIWQGECYWPVDSDGWYAFKY